MVKINGHELSVAGLTYTPTREMALLAPTALSPATVSYGADTCSDHPAPATMTGQVFIPADYTAKFPTLNDTVNYTVASESGIADVFRGRINGLTIEDRPGYQPPAVVPYSRNITQADATARWTFRRGTLEAPAGILPLTAPGGNQVRGVVPAGDFQGIISTYRVPVTAGESYVFTALALAGTAFNRVGFSWSTPAGAHLGLDIVQVSYIWAKNDEWVPVITQPGTAPAGAGYVNVMVEMEPTNTTAREIRLDTVNLVPAADAGRRRAGRWVTFQASDITATAARYMVGGLPFPIEPAFQRVTRINTLVPQNVMTFQMETSDSTELAYRDIDNQSALSVFQRLVTSIGNVALADPQFETLIITAKPPRFPVSLEVIAGNPVLVDDPALVQVPAGCIQQGPLSTSITGLSNSVRFNYRVATEDGSEDATENIVNHDSIAVYGPMARSIDTDLPAAAGRAWQDAQRMVQAQGQPFYRLADQAKVVVSQLPPLQTSMDLFGAMEGFRRLVMIPDAPEVIGKYHRVHAASMTFGKVTDLSLSLEPADLIPATAVTFGNLMQAPYAPMPISKFTELSSADLATASRAAGY